MEHAKKKDQSVHEYTIDNNSELDDSSVDRAVRTNSETDSNARTSDFSQDVDSQERIRTNAVSYDESKQQAEIESQRRDRTNLDSNYQADLENKRRDRSSLDYVVEADRRAIDQAVKLQDQLNQAYASHFVNILTLQQKQLGDLINAGHMGMNQDRRHVDHTLGDLHGDESGGTCDKS